MSAGALAALVIAAIAATGARAAPAPTPAQWTAAYKACEKADFAEGRLPLAKALAAYGRAYQAVLRAENALIPTALGATRYDDAFNQLSAPFGRTHGTAFAQDLTAPAKTHVWADFCGDVYQRKSAAAAHARQVELRELGRLAGRAAQLPAEVSQFDAVVSQLEGSSDPFLARFANRLASVAAPLGSDAAAVVRAFAAWKRHITGFALP